MNRDTEVGFGRSFRAGLRKVRRRIEELDPELVVLFGGAHPRAFTTIVPVFCLALVGQA